MTTATPAAPFPDDARAQLVAAGDEIAAGGDPRRILSARVPWLLSQIEVDVADRRFAQWGSSTVLDEKLRTPVIPLALFDLLHHLAGLEAHWPVGNAGVLHVYGYLLSAVDTRYGPKRTRWLGTQLATALDLPEDYFAPWFDPQSTPLERVTSVAHEILGEPESTAALWFWAEEFAGGATDAGVMGGDVLMRIAVVRRPVSADGVLVYGMVGVAGVRLVTMFPITGLAELWVNDLLGSAPRLRYNAVAPGLDAQAPLANRRVLRRP